MKNKKEQKALIDIILNFIFQRRIKAKIKKIETELLYLEQTQELIKLFYELMRRRDEAFSQADKTEHDCDRRSLMGQFHAYIDCIDLIARIIKKAES